MSDTQPYYPSLGGVDGNWEPPNIVYVLCDDIGYGDLGCFGQEQIQTPRLDEMAGEGTRFTECYAGSPVCAPSRSTFLTGHHAGHTRVRHNMGTLGGVHVVDNGPRQHRVPLGPDDPSVADLLSDAGYATGGFGKWGLGEPDTSGLPTRQGFDKWFGYLNQRRAHTHYPPYLWDGEERVDIDANDGDARGQHAQDLVMEHALEFIEGNADDRFFCYLPTTLPHTPLAPPDEASLEPYEDADMTEEERAYASMVTRVDRDVGRILDTLSELGIDDRTIVFFSSDHGPAEQVAASNLDSAGGLRGSKRDLYEGGIRTPMIVRWPGQVPAGRTSEASWYYPDVLPTLAELAGVWPDPGHQDVTEADGVSVLPTLLGEEQPLDERVLYWEFDQHGFGQAARVGDWKAVRQDVNAPTELYDLSKDPHEENDLASSHPSLVSRFEWRFDEAHTPSKYWPV